MVKPLKLIFQRLIYGVWGFGLMECGEPRLDPPWHGQVAFSTCQGLERKLPAPLKRYDDSNCLQGSTALAPRALAQVQYGGLL